MLTNVLAGVSRRAHGPEAPGCVCCGVMAVIAVFAILTALPRPMLWPGRELWPWPENLQKALFFGHFLGARGRMLASPAVILGASCVPGRWHRIISVGKEISMVSQRKLEANCRNAQKSTGPKTARG